MFENVTPEKAIAYTKISVVFACCVPLPETASKFHTVCFKIVRVVSIISALGLLLPLMFALYIHRDIILLTRAACTGLMTIFVLIQTYLYTIQYDRIRGLINEMTAYCKAANSYEISVFQSYVDKYCTFYVLSASVFYTTTVIVVCGTVFTAEPFPTVAEYPFPVDYEPLRSTIFMHQAIVGVQVAAHVNMSMFQALLLLFAAARFEILSVELRNATNADGLVECLKKYDNVRKNAMEIIDIFQYIVLATIVISSMEVVLCGLILIGKQREPFASKFQFVAIMGTALVTVFMCAWPADNLMDVSENAVRGAYESVWYMKSLRMQKTVFHMLIPQQPVAISIKCLIPGLSLDYYCSYVSNAFSIFTALRTLLHDENAN